MLELPQLAVTCEAAAIVRLQHTMAGGMRGVREYFNPVRRTLILVNMASLVEKADEVLLPAVFYEVGEAFGVSVGSLGSLTFVRGIVQVSFSWSYYK